MLIKDCAPSANQEMTKLSICFGNTAQHIN